MSKAYTCDACAVEQPHQDGFEPRGWFSMAQRWDGGDGPIPQTKHFCSPACAITYLRTLETPTADAPAAA